MTTKDKILLLLMQGRKLTHLDVLREVHTTEIRTRISEIEKMFDIKVSRETIHLNDKWFNAYSLEPKIRSEIYPKLNKELRDLLPQFIPSEQLKIF